MGIPVAMGSTDTTRVELVVVVLVTPEVLACTAEVPDCRSTTAPRSQVGSPEEKMPLV